MARSRCGDGTTASIGTESSPRSADDGHVWYRCPSRRKAPADLRALGDLLRATEQIGDLSCEGPTVEGLSHHVADPLASEGAPRPVWRRGEKEDRKSGERGVRLNEVEHVDTAETGKIDVEDEQIRPVSRDRVEDESTVVDRRCLDGKMFLERRLDRRGRIRIVLSDEDALHTTSRKARARRKIRSLVQSLQRHMSLDDATTVPAVVRPLP